MWPAVLMREMHLSEITQRSNHRVNYMTSSTFTKKIISILFLYMHNIICASNICTVFIVEYTLDEFFYVELDIMIGIIIGLFFQLTSVMFAAIHTYMGLVFNAISL